MSSRSKGLSYVREVRRILEGMGQIVEGPGYKSAFYGGKLATVHADYFGCFDLISWDGINFVCHQVSTLTNKAEKVKALQARQMPGWVWCRTDKPVGYRIWQVNRIGGIYETEMRFVPKQYERR